MEDNETWIVGTARQKLVESRSRVNDRIVVGDEVRIPVEPFHAVRPGTDPMVGACGAEVQWSFDEMEFGTRAQNCPRCTAALAE